MADSSVLNLHNSLRQAKERWAVFLGAGSSYDYGIPTMGEIAEILRGLVRDNKPIHGITEPTLILLKTLCPNNEKTPAKWNIEDLLTRLSQLFDATKDVHDAFAKVSTTVGDSEIPETTIRTAKSKPITVFDLSFLPSETVGTVVATISRMLFQVHFLADRGTTTPTLAVYEEAHNYISRIGRGAYGGGSGQCRAYC